MFIASDKSHSFLLKNYLMSARSVREDNNIICLLQSLYNIVSVRNFCRQNYYIHWSMIAGKIPLIIVAT